MGCFEILNLIFDLITLSYNVRVRSCTQSLNSLVPCLLSQLWSHACQIVVKIGDQILWMQLNEEWHSNGRMYNKDSFKNISQWNMKAFGSHFWFHQISNYLPTLGGY